MSLIDSLHLLLDCPFALIFTEYSILELSTVAVHTIPTPAFLFAYAYDFLHLLPGPFG